MIDSEVGDFATTKNCVLVSKLTGLGKVGQMFGESQQIPWIC